MHNFSELIERCTSFTLHNLAEVQNMTLKALENSASTIHIKNLQMINLQKTFFIVGVFSFYESILQDRLNCRNGFEEAKRILKKNDENLLLEKFTELFSIINVLKHGKGRSYENLIHKNSRKIEIRIKEPEEMFFEEGNVDEISSLIEVNDDLISQAISIINEVSSIIENDNPEIII